MDADDYRLYIGGKSNFRYEVAHTQPYKGKRAEKPILFNEIREQFIQKYRRKVVIADNCEAEDLVSIEAHKALDNYKKTGKWDCVIGFIDKDVNQVYCPYFNYRKTEQGIVYPTVTDCMRSLAIQMVKGDNQTDNIRGLPDLPLSICQKYGLKKYNGCGTATLEKLFADKNVKEMFQIVVEAYKEYYGEEKKPFISHRGEELHWNWLDYLKETAILVYLQRYEGERYNVEDTLKKLNIDY